MKKIKSTLFPFLMTLMLVFAVGCESSSDGDVELKDDLTYTVTFVLTSLSDMYIDCGTVKLNYLDSDGQAKTINITKDLIPGKITVSDLYAGDSYYFEVYFERSTTLPSLTETSYTTAKGFNLYQQRSDEDNASLLNFSSSSSTIAADKVEEYVDKYTGTNIIEVSGTVK